jgi:adenosylhomocysteinase
MAYHFQGTHLRVLQKFSRQQRNVEFLSNTRGVFVLHALKTSVEFIRNLTAAGLEINSIFVKPYSIDQDALRHLRALCENVHILDYDRYDAEGRPLVERALVSCVEASKHDAKSIIGFDIGGYLLDPVFQVFKDDPSLCKFFKGIVEDTTYGHNRYLKVKGAFPTPVLSVARSQLKEIEARFVGRDAVVACDMVLRQQGIMLSGRKAFSIGYGMIGSNVARALRDNDLVVSVYDKRDCRNLHAYMEGFDVNKKGVLIKSADIIFSQTADRAVSFSEIEECKDGVVLASVGSKNTEFDIAEIERQAISRMNYGKHIEEFTLSNSKRVRVIHGGAAVNFLNPSLPTEVFDLVFSEAFIAIMLLLKRHNAFPPGNVYEISETFQNEISKDWLRTVNS